MFTSLRARFREFRRQRRFVALRRADAAALTHQAPPDPGRVLVVRNDSIGDYLLYRPWLRQLSQVVRGRGQRLTLMANAIWAPLAQAWDGDLFDELLAVDFGRFLADLAYRAELVKLLGSQGFGEVIYPLHAREGMVENFIPLLQAPVRITSQGAPRPGPVFVQLTAGYTQVLPSTRAVLFEYDRNREFFEHWQQAEAARRGETPPPPPPRAPLTLPASVLAAGTVAAAASGPYIVLFPGASARQKRWPAALFGQVAKALHQHYGARYRLVLAGSPADTVFAHQVVQAAGPGVPLDNRCGQTDLPGLAALVAGAQLLLSNDTVTAHLAVQAGTPCVVVLMGENYGKFFPYPPTLLQAPCRCIFPPSQEARFARGDFSPPLRDPDINQVEPGRVLAAARELLGE